MTTPLDSSSPEETPVAAAATEPQVQRPLRFWPIVLVLAGFWAYQLLSPSVELATHVRFFSRIGVSLAVVLGFTLWWFWSKRFTRRERWAWFGATLVVL